MLKCLILFFLFANSIIALSQANDSLMNDNWKVGGRIMMGTNSRYNITGLTLGESFRLPFTKLKRKYFLTKVFF
jgi:hypothetical protein